MAAYRGGICANLTHERGHLRLFDTASWRSVWGDIGSQPREPAMVFAR